MRQHSLILALALAASASLTGCATERHSVAVGEYKILTGRMGPTAQRWEVVKASLAGWEVVASSQDDDCGVLVLHKRK